MGIDPGLAAGGLGIIDQEGQQMDVLEVATIRTEPSVATEERLDLIWAFWEQQITKHRPSCLGIEEQGQAWHGAEKEGKTNFKALAVHYIAGMARGLGKAYGARVYVITPAQAKMALCGTARADKHQMKARVQAMVGEKLRFSQHASDAVGIAVAALRRYKTHQATGRRLTAVPRRRS